MEIVRFAPGRRNAGTWRLGIILHADETKITSVTKEIKYTIYDCFVGDIAFKVSQTAADMMEINANHFKIKRKSSEHSTQNFLLPFGNIENVDPVRRNLGGGGEINRTISECKFSRTQT